MSKKKKTNITEEQKDFIADAQDKLEKPQNPERESKAPENVADDDGLCDIGANCKVPMDLLLRIKVSHLEGDLLTKELKALRFELQSLKQTEVIKNLQISDFESQIKKKNRDHKDLIEDISRQAGVELKDSIINFETGEVTFA